MNTIFNYISLIDGWIVSQKNLSYNFNHNPNIKIHIFMQDIMANELTGDYLLSCFLPTKPCQYAYC
jgi:hypothetical protein